MGISMTAGPASVGALGDCSEVAPRLYLGNAAAARDVALLRRLNVAIVVNVADDLAKAGFKPLEQAYAAAPAASGPQRRSEPLPDTPTEDFDLLQHLDASSLIGDLARVLQTEEIVLVHCVSGRNRSATVACAVLMTLHRSTARATLSWLQRVRPIVRRGDGH